MQQQSLITWIASYPRSGNTWVRAFITAYANNGTIDINNIMQTGDKHPAYYASIIKPPIGTWTMADQAMLKPAAMMRMLGDAGNNLILKTHDCNLAIAGVEQIPPNLTRTAIYVVRDPRDVALSFKNHYAMPTMEAAVDQMLNDETLTRFPDSGLFVPQRSWQKHVGSWTRTLPYEVLTLRYEDLLENPFEHFSKVVRLLKMDFDARLIKKSIEACSFEKFQAAEQASGFQEGVGQTFFYKGQAKRWKKELDPALQDRVVKACRQQMKIFDYRY